MHLSNYHSVIILSSVSHGNEHTPGVREIENFHVVMILYNKVVIFTEQSTKNLSKSVVLVLKARHGTKDCIE